MTFGDKVTTKLLRCSSRNGSRRTESLESVCIIWSRLVEIQLVNPMIVLLVKCPDGELIRSLPCFASSSGSFGRCDTWSTTVNESCAVSLVVDPLEVNYERLGVMFGVGQHLCSKQRNNMIADDFRRFI